MPPPLTEPTELNYPQLTTREVSELKAKDARVGQ
jgi:hypothetical protein